MDTTELISLLELLDDDIDGLEAALAPLTEHALPDMASRLPLLDKAQLYVLVTYAIENILFSYLRLNGINAKEHAVFRELTRVKQYFEKIKSVENAGSKRENLSLDNSAAQRMIKHALPPEIQSWVGDDNSPRKKRKKSKQEKLSPADG
ncbi:MAG: hypothetical protein LQ343_001863 [Gyalolechia ehrenbergii]|nr:MAG: hypothetical protein LQ343_001863 [Gyalolechia ehrenbergii]